MVLTAADFTGPLIGVFGAVTSDARETINEKAGISEISWCAFEDVNL